MFIEFLLYRQAELSVLLYAAGVGKVWSQAGRGCRDCRGVIVGSLVCIWFWSGTDSPRVVSVPFG